jgi:hypothetical protein
MIRQTDKCANSATESYKYVFILSDSSLHCFVAMKQVIYQVILVFFLEYLQHPTYRVTWRTTVHWNLTVDSFKIPTAIFHGRRCQAGQHQAELAIVESMMSCIL